MPELRKPGILLGRRPGNTASKSGQYLAAYGEQFVMLAAEPGSGKGVGVVIPNLLSYPDSVIVFDPKGENWSKTAGWRRQQGHECYCFRPNDLASHRWNVLDCIRRDPLYRLGDIDGIGSILFAAGAEAQNASFFRTAQNFFTAIVLFLLDVEGAGKGVPVTLPQVYEIACSAEGIDRWAAMVMEIADLSDETRRELSVVIAAGKNPETFSSFTGILKQRLSIYGKKTIAAAVSASDFNFDDLRKKRISVYICLTVEELNNDAMRQLVNLLFSQAIRQNTRVEPQQGGTGPDGDYILKYQVLFLMDEFAVLGKVDIMEIAPALTRSFNVRYLIIFQNKDQLRSSRLYGSQGANAIMDAFHIEIVFAMSSVSSATEYSKRLGNTTERVSSRSRSSSRGGMSNSTSESLQARPLMLPQEIMALPYEDELIFIQGTNRSKPLKVRARKIFWYQDPDFLKRSAIPAPVIDPQDAEQVLRLTDTGDQVMARIGLTPGMLNFRQTITDLDFWQKSLMNTRFQTDTQALTALEVTRQIGTATDAFMFMKDKSDDDWQQAARDLGGYIQRIKALIADCNRRINE